MSVPPYTMSCGGCRTAMRLVASFRCRWNCVKFYMCSGCGKTAAFKGKRVLKH